jgi:hypothetical protein
MMTVEKIREQAELLAKENREAEPTIERVYWFPDEEEVRLVELTPVVPQSQEGRLRPFYFRASPQDGLPAPSGIALIRPEEFGRLEVPRGWPAWDAAVELPKTNGHGAA